MANPEHLKILKQGLEVWNRWRKENPEIQPDLSEANLSKTELFGVNLSRVDLTQANLYQANLSRTNLRKACFARAILTETDFSYARLSLTIFVNIDLRMVKGLETVTYESPLSIGIDTIYNSGQKISDNLLQMAGVPDDLLDYIHRTDRPIVPYTPEQIDHWLASLQKRLTIILKNIARLEEKKSLVGPVDVPLKILNELDEYEIERADVETQIIQFKQYRDDLD